MTNKIERRGRKPIQGLTPAQKRIMGIIREFCTLHPYPPTAKEIGEELGIKTPSVHEQLRKLEAKGFIRRQARKARSIEILKFPSRGGLRAVQILGEVIAGSPMWAEENIIGEVMVEERYARGSCFALKVRGDSMIEADIHEGDYIIVRRQQLAESGDIVVALLGNEATVKRLFISDLFIELRPENPKYSPIRITPEDELMILGKVTAVRNTTHVNGDG
ncbi:transcriptional repressor LexA [Magnetococcales bacterium HHB-1]